MAPFAPHDVLVPAGGRYPHDALSVLADEWSNCADDKLALSPLGGGEVDCLSAQEVSRRGLRKVEPDELRSKFYRARHSFDVGPHWWAWTTGHRWNGWGTPHFERPEAQAVLEWLEQQGEIRGWAWTGDLLCAQGDAGEDPECWTAETIDTPLGERVIWPVGAVAWTWWVDEDDERRALASLDAIGLRTGNSPEDEAAQIKKRLMA